jgi:multidrug efflux pump
MFDRPRAVIALLLILLAAGFYAYQTIPKESAPEVAIPTLIVSVSLSGISPVDAATQLAQPLSDEVSGIEGLEKVETTARLGSAQLTLTFTASFDSQQALDDVRRAVDRAKSKLPSEADDPTVLEINTSLFPIGSIVLSGQAQERTLTQIAQVLQDELETIPGVLEADVIGVREEVVDILISQEDLQKYNLQLGEVLSLISNNNLLVAAGTARNAQGDIVVSLPGLVENARDLQDIPIKITPDKVLTIKDVATIRSTFKDKDSASALNGEPAISIDIKKKTGANVIETMEAVEAVIAVANERFPAGVTAQIVLNESTSIKDLLSTLEANVIASIILVMGVILWGMGFKNALLVGLGVPGAFLAGVLALNLMGYTMNLVVLFALILVVGLLVDGTIVSVEYADTLRKKGVPGRQAFYLSAKRMTGPIISSSATSIAVFFPLLFWDQTVGDFMKYLPITVILTLSSSVVMALIFVPVVGSVIMKDSHIPDIENTEDFEESIEHQKNAYSNSLSFLIDRPFLVITVAVCMLVGGIQSFREYGAGVEFFPSVEPDAVQISVYSQDTMSFDQKNTIMTQIDLDISDVDGLKYITRQVASNNAKGEVGSLRLTLQDWWARDTANVISQKLRQEAGDIPGVTILITQQQGGPGGAKPFLMKIFPGETPDTQKIKDIKSLIMSMGGFIDVETDLPTPGVEWKIDVDKDKAAQYGADLSLIGQSSRLFTDGVFVTNYRPTGKDDSIDIRVRIEESERNLDGLLNFKIPTQQGYIPLTDIATITPQTTTGFLTYEDGRLVNSISASLDEGYQLTQLTADLTKILDQTYPDLDWELGGDSKEQAESSQFLGMAFLVAIVMMFFILLIQFNKIWQTLLVLSAIVFSIGGVFWAITLSGSPFIVVMGGIGIIALAGLVVNTNILLIDTWNILIREGKTPKEAALISASARLRPILLTTITTALGLLPMAMGLSLDILGGHWEFGAPATQWWVELAITITGGLTFATLITLYLTPVMLAQTWSIRRKK